MIWSYFATNIWGKDALVRTEKDGFVLLDKPALEELAMS
jgi:hypothetical protein